MKLGLRITFSLLFFTILLSTALTTTQQRDKIPQSECLRDETFLLTANVNSFLADHSTFTNGFIIYSSMMMDFLIVSFCILFFLYWKSSRVVITYILFFGLRTIVQVSATYVSYIILIEKLLHEETWRLSLQVPGPIIFGGRLPWF